MIEIPAGHVEEKVSKEGPDAKGVRVIKAYIRTLPGKPGVYRMFGPGGDVLYIGKAKDLKKRVSAYAKPERQSARIQQMIRQTASMEFVTTHTEAEALLLEANLIKELTPRYNILLRDDKSFPHILLTAEHAFPRILKHRGTRRDKGEYFGPFASAGAVNDTLNTLQRTFLLRTCSDSTFNSRTRPCLLYQIKRCSAPCVGKVDEDEYGVLTEQARAFLRGKSRRIQQELAARMQTASDAQEYEEAAQYRDRIRALTHVQAHQVINPSTLNDADAIAAFQEGGLTCVQVFFFRGGRNFGNRAYFPNHAKEDSLAAVLEAFIGQFYASKPPPGQVLLSHRLSAQSLIAEALSLRAGRQVRVSCPQQGDKRVLIEHAQTNAQEALARRVGENTSRRRLLASLASTLNLESTPERIEVYDNSHISGKQAVGAMIVAGPEGPVKSAYRKFNIRGGATFAPGDDYAMMREVLTRRFTRALKEDPDRRGRDWPGLILVDGGKGQLAVAREVLADLGIEDIAVGAIAKGEQRNAGRERIFMPGADALTLDPRDPVLYYLQRLRDEAHRFAIGAHRQKRAQGLPRSLLDEIPGIGAKRKRALLHHFGSARAVEQAGKVDLEAVEGVSRAIAGRIYGWFHKDS